MALIDPLLLPPDYDSETYSREPGHDGTDPHKPGYRRSWRGLIFVFRTGASEPFASRLEADAGRVLQARPEVVDLHRAPHSIEYRDGTRWRSYTPDWIVWTDDFSSPRVVEVKPEKKVIAKRAMLEAVTDAVHRTGSPFEVMSEQDIYRKNLFANSGAVCSAGRLQGLDAQEVFRMAALLRERESLRVTDVLDFGWRRSQARDLLLHLAAWGRCVFDMSRPFHDRTVFVERTGR